MCCPVGTRPAANLLTARVVGWAGRRGREAGFCCPLLCLRVCTVQMSKWIIGLLGGGGIGAMHGNQKEPSSVFCRSGFAPFSCWLESFLFQAFSSCISNFRWEHAQVITSHLMIILLGPRGFSFVALGIIGSGWRSRKRWSDVHWCEEPKG